MSRCWRAAAALLYAALSFTIVSASELEPAAVLKGHPHLATDGGLIVSEGTAFAVVPLPRQVLRGPSDLRLRAEEGAKVMARVHLADLLRELIGRGSPIAGIATEIVSRPAVAAVAWYSAPELAKFELARELPQPTATPTPAPTFTPILTAMAPPQPPQAVPSTPTANPSRLAPAAPTPSTPLGGQGSAERDRPTVQEAPVQGAGTEGAAPEHEQKPIPPATSIPIDSPDETGATHEPVESMLAPTAIPIPKPPPTCHSAWFEGSYPQGHPALSAQMVRICGGRPGVAPVELVRKATSAHDVEWAIGEDDRLLIAIEPSSRRARLFRAQSYTAGCWCWTEISVSVSPTEEKRLGGEMRSSVRQDSNGTSLICVLPTSNSDLLGELQSSTDQLGLGVTTTVTSDGNAVIAHSTSTSTIRIFTLVARFVDLTGREIRRYQEVQHLDQLGQ